MLGDRRFSSWKKKPSTRIRIFFQWFLFDRKVHWGPFATHNSIIIAQMRLSRFQFHEFILFVSVVVISQLLVLVPTGAQDSSVSGSNDGMARTSEHFNWIILTFRWLTSPFGFIIHRQIEHFWWCEYGGLLLFFFPNLITINDRLDFFVQRQTQLSINIPAPNIEIVECWNCRTVPSASSNIYDL